jgi:hypothetical protein
MFILLNKKNIQVSLFGALPVNISSQSLHLSLVLQLLLSRLDEILVIMSVLTFKLAVILYALLYILYTYLLRFEIYTILDLSCDKRFLRAISYRRRKRQILRCEMQQEVYFKQNMSTIVCLSRIW